jgi:hypothetical protein
MQSEEIEEQRAELARLRKLLESQLASSASEQAIAATRRAIADCEEALRSSEILVDNTAQHSQPAATRQHTLNISGNAQVTNAIAGDMYLDIHQNIHYPKRPAVGLGCIYHIEQTQFTTRDTRVFEDCSYSFRVIEKNVTGRSIGK